ncbi:CgeB family protein [Endothiovibrio diazotrophicus]
MKILYAAALGGTALHRMHALERAGHALTPFDFAPYQAAGGALLRRLRQRLLVGPTVARLNRDLSAAVRRGGGDLVWLDKGQMVHPDTVARLAAEGHRLVHYSSDLPSSVRGDPGWRLVRRAVRHYHAVVVPSRGHDAEYRALGARHILRMPFGFEPGVHRPPPAGWDAGECRYDVTFIGTPYEQRPAFLLRLVRDYGIRVKVFGDRWERHLGAEELRLLEVEPGVYGADYREAIWRSRILLGFVTHAMHHASARRWSEISACGGFLLAERTAEAGEWFEEGREAAFFGDERECAERIRHWLAHPAERRAVAAAGMRRTREERENDRLMAAAVEAAVRLA